MAACYTPPVKVRLPGELDDDARIDAIQQQAAKCYPRLGDRSISQVSLAVHHECDDPLLPRQSKVVGRRRSVALRAELHLKCPREHDTDEDAQRGKWDDFS